MITGTDVLNFVNGASASDAEYAQQCADAAMVQVDNHIGTAVVPVFVLDRAYILVAAEMFNQKEAPNGIAQYSDSVGNLSTMRVARDPMRAAYSLLAPYLPGGFA